MNDLKWFPFCDLKFSWTQGKANYDNLQLDKQDFIIEYVQMIIYFCFRWCYIYIPDLKTLKKRVFVQICGHTSIKLYIFDSFYFQITAMKA